MYFIDFEFSQALSAVILHFFIKKNRIQRKIYVHFERNKQRDYFLLCGFEKYRNFNNFSFNVPMFNVLKSSSDLISQALFRKACRCFDQLIISLIFDLFPEIFNLYMHLQNKYKHNLVKEMLCFVWFHLY